MTRMERYWFRRRRYGYGWTPCTWQGWLSLAVFLIVVIGGVSVWHSTVGSIVTVAVAGVVFIGLCIVKGERPGWRWGRRD